MNGDVRSVSVANLLVNNILFKNFVGDIISACLQFNCYAFINFFYRSAVLLMRSFNVMHSLLVRLGRARPTHV